MATGDERILILLYCLSEVSKLVCVDEKFRKFSKTFDIIYPNIFSCNTMRYFLCDIQQALGDRLRYTVAVLWGSDPRAVNTVRLKSFVTTPSNNSAVTEPCRDWSHNK